MKYTLIFTDVDNNSFEIDINTNEKNINLIAGTLSNKVVKFITLMRKYNQKIGFKFARKFDVQFLQDNKEIKSFNGISLNGEQFGVKLTLVNNEKSKTKFSSFMGEFIKDLVYTMGEDEKITTSKLLKELAK